MHNPLRSKPLMVIPDRKPPTRAEKVAAWNRENGICYLCGKPVAFDGPGVQWDHRDNRAVSANDDVSNLYPVHPGGDCHAKKTPLDIKRTAKAKRQEKLTMPRVKKPGGFRPDPRPKGQRFGRKFTRTNTGAE